MKTGFGFYFSTLAFALSMTGCSQSGGQGAAVPATVVPLGYNASATNSIRFTIQSRRLDEPALVRVDRHGGGVGHAGHLPQSRPDILVSGAPLSISRAFSVQQQGYISCTVTPYGSLHVVAGNQNPRAAETISLDMLNFPFGNYGATVARASGADAFQGRIMNQATEIDFVSSLGSVCDYKIVYSPSGVAGHLTAKFQCEGMLAANRPNEVASSSGKFDCDISAH